VILLGRIGRMTRKFGDERYSFHTALPKKSHKADAQFVAKEIREKGHKARVTKVKHGYIIWEK
jgi:hypothetical protein